ncbi:unnamed protein product [Calypogeia fissa]
MASIEGGRGYSLGMGMLPDYLYKYGGMQGSPLRSSVLDAVGCAPHSSPLTPSSSVSALNMLRRNLGSFSSPARTGDFNGRSSVESRRAKFMAPSAVESGGIELYSMNYFYTCAVGGAICCGVTHCGMTPIDVIKCNMQIDPVKYNSILGGFKTAFQEAGVAGLVRGWVPTLLGYSVQGAGKYGFYEFFKYYYAEQVGPETAQQYKTLLYLSASASGEFLADIGLCPFEAVKVRVQTQPGFAKGISDGLPKILASDGIAGLYKGLVPLWGRQIPYTMMKFSTFETTVEYLYKNVVTVPKDELGGLSQLGVSFVAGYIAGIACAIISHPADNLVSYLNSKQGATLKMAVDDMGTLALFTRGLPLRIFMIGTLTAAQWLIYDAFKVYVGLPTTGGH